MTDDREILRATRALTPQGLAEDVAVEVDSTGRIRAVRPGRAGDPPALDGLLLPGLINAHLHLELSWAAGHVPGGDGLAAWVGRLFAAQRDAPPTDVQTREALYAAYQLRSYGVAAVCDISSGEPSQVARTASLLAAAGLSGVVQREILGMHGPDISARVASAEATEGHARGHGGTVHIRPSPHGVYSTPVDVVHACAAWTAARSQGDAPPPPPASIHLAEDPSERRFLADGTGPWADFLDAIGRDWAWWEPPGLSPVAWLAHLGVLGPDVLAVHGVDLDDRDRDLLAKSGASLCLCPRSNLHIHHTLPDVAALVDAGISLCLGTDSLASAPDLDVLAECRVLAQRFPSVDPIHWLRAATHGGADALRLVGRGRIEVGTAPGLLRLEGLRAPSELGTRASLPSRHILTPPGPP